MGKENSVQDEQKRKTLKILLALGGAALFELLIGKGVSRYGALKFF